MQVEAGLATTYITKYSYFLVLFRVFPLRSGRGPVFLRCLLLVNVLLFFFFFRFFVVSLFVFYFRETQLFCLFAAFRVMTPGVAWHTACLGRLVASL